MMKRERPTTEANDPGVQVPISTPQRAEMDPDFEVVDPLGCAVEHFEAGCDLLLERLRLLIHDQGEEEALLAAHGAIVRAVLGLYKPEDVARRRELIVQDMETEIDRATLWSLATDTPPTPDHALRPELRRTEPWAQRRAQQQALLDR